MFGVKVQTRNAPGALRELSSQREDNMGSANGVVTINKKLALAVLGGLLVFLGNSTVVRADKPQFANTDSVAGSRGSETFAGSGIVTTDSFFAFKGSVNPARINTSSIEETGSFGEIRSDAVYFKHFGITGSPVISNSVSHFETNDLDHHKKHNSTIDNDGDPTPTPEPGTWLLSLTGAVALGLMSRRRALV